MTTTVANQLVTFISPPSLKYVPHTSYYAYKLTSAEGSVLIRKFSRANIVQDLISAFTLIGPSSKYTVSFDLSPEELNTIPTLIYNTTRQHSRAWCVYDIHTYNIIGLYSNEAALAKALDLTPRVAVVCNVGAVSVLKQRYVTSLNYLSPEQLAQRKTATYNVKRVQIYVYDYLGDHIGTFKSMVDAACTLSVPLSLIRGGLANPEHNVMGYYFYNNPNQKPSIKIDKLL